MKLAFTFIFVSLFAWISLQADHGLSSSRHPFDEVIFYSPQFQDYTIYQLADYIRARTSSSAHFKDMNIVISKRGEPYKKRFSITIQPGSKVTLGQFLSLFLEYDLQYSYVSRQKTLVLGDTPLVRVLKEEDIDFMNLETGEMQKR